jgi:hypothetical protein
VQLPPCRFPLLAWLQPASWHNTKTGSLHAPRQDFFLRYEEAKNSSNNSSKSSPANSKKVPKTAKTASSTATAANKAAVATPAAA